jgi:Tfp pilus assembly protein PilW
MPSVPVPSLRPRPRVRCGLTIVELLLALAITGVIGAAIASVVYATCEGTASRQNLLSLVVRRKVVESRTAGLLRSAEMVLAYGANSLVLWMYDTNLSGTPNRSEIRYLEFDPTTGQLACYKNVWPNTMTPVQILAADTEYALSADFNTLIPALKTDPNFVREVWATNVTAVQFTPNSTNLQTATLVTYSVTLTNGAVSEVIVNAAALHNAVILSQGSDP